MGWILVPSLAVLRISVYNQIGRPDPRISLLGQATLPLAYLRQGYRYAFLDFNFGQF